MLGMTPPAEIVAWPTNLLSFVLDGELDVTRDDAGLLVVLRRVAAELKELRHKVLENGRHVDGSTGADALGVAALAQEAADAAHREGQAGLRRLALHTGGLLATGALLTLAGHGGGSALIDVSRQDCEKSCRNATAWAIPGVIFPASTGTRKCNSPTQCSTPSCTTTLLHPLSFRIFSCFASGYPA